ncbi:hypothetical protein KI387_026617, partial [Taxus chinensis]
MSAPSQLGSVQGEHDSALTILEILDHMWFRDNIVRPSPPHSTRSSCSMYEATPCTSIEMATSDAFLLFSESEGREAINNSQHSSITAGISDSDSESDSDYGGEMTSIISPPSCAKAIQHLPIIQGFPKLETIPYDNHLEKRRVPDLGIQQTSMRRRERQRATKSMTDLESDEVKGFMDLGFKFNMDNLNPHIVTMLPGLQRLGGQGKTQTHLAPPPVSRPYLSEAWLIRRPDSPLLNLRMPSLHDGVDMKKHLKFWA